MAREERATENKTPGQYSARGVNLSSYITIIGNCNTEVKIT